ncbi:MAG: histidine phosphatase family protein [Ilumatobacteraceae bacterium]
MPDDAQAPPDPVPTRLVLIRHGESRSSVARAIGGPRTCGGLSDLGRQQCERLARRLGETGELSDVVLYASQYPRAAETAEIVAPALGGPEIHIDARFGEHDPGPDIDGLTFEEFLACYGMPDWESDPHAVTFPGGETIADLHHRVGSAVRDVVAADPGRTIVVCCHGGVVNAVLRMALRAPVTGAFELFTTNASLTELVLVRPGRWRLQRYNDAAHLAGLPIETPRPSGPA